MGADHTYLVKSRDARENAANITALFGGESPDVTIECSGAEPSLQTGIYVSISLDDQMKNSSMRVPCVMMENNR